MRFISYLVMPRLKTKKTVFISLRTPYEMQHFADVSDSMLATFAYNTHSWVDSEGKTKVFGASFESLAKVFSGEIDAKGVLPVSVNGLSQAD